MGWRGMAGVAWAVWHGAHMAWSCMAWADVPWADVAWTGVAWAGVTWAGVAWAGVAWASVARTGVLFSILFANFSRILTHGFFIQIFLIVSRI